MLGRKTAAVVCLALILARSAGARQSTPEAGSQPWTGDAGVTRLVLDIMAADAAKSGEPRVSKSRGARPKLERRGLANAVGAPPSPSWPPLRTPLAAAAAGPLLPQTVGSSFLAVQISESPFIPPDSMGAAGPTQFLVAVNGRIKVFDKTGVLGALNAALDTFFAPALPAGSAGTSDPRVRFDRLTDRWFLTCISVDTPNRILLAVSSGPTITSASSFTFFFFQHDLVGTITNADTGGFADYDTLGLDVNALYVGANIFNAAGTSLIGTSGYVVRKTSILGGGPIVVTAFRQLVVGTGAGPYTPQGVDNDDPAATEGYFIGVDNAAFGQLQLRRVSNPGGTPTISGNIPVAVPATSFPRDVSALGSTQLLDAADDRLFMAQIKNGSLWTTHNINVTSAGVATTTLGTTGRNGARWYELTTLSTTPTLRQSGTLFDATTVVTGTARHTWMPSLAVSGQNHMALGHSIAAPTNSAGTQIQPSVGAGGRLAGDALGTTRATTIVIPGAGNYNVQTTATQRWGDFSFTSVDPTDNMTMWTVQEYCNATDSWGVGVARLDAPPPVLPTAASPASATQGTGSILVVVTGPSVTGSGFYDPGAGFAKRLSASVTGGVTVNSVTFTNPTSVTLDLNVPVGAALGPQDITIVNPDGQSRTLAAGFNVMSLVPATVTAVNSTTGDGGYGAGAIVTVAVSFSTSVKVTGTPHLTLETGPSDAVVNFTSGNNTATLIFGYLVNPGDASPDLDVASALALELNGGTIKDFGGTNAVLTLPSPGTAGSLGANRALVIDTTPPDTSIATSPAAASNSSTAVFTFSSTKPAGASFEVSLDGAPFSANGASTTATLNALADGGHTFQVRATDATSPGNLDPTAASFSWTIDTVAPGTSLTTTPPDPDTNTTPTFDFQSTEATSTFQYRLDGGAWIPTGAPATLASPLAGGVHTFEVQAIDAAGNGDPSPALFSWTVDAPPATPAGSGSHHHGCGLLGTEVGLALLLARGRRLRRREASKR